MPRRTAAETTGAILVAAREQFARDGLDRTTVRSVAAQAGVDPALVIRYFGSKAELFARAADLDLGIPDLTGLTPAAVVDVLVDRFLTVWEGDGTFLVLLRASTTSAVAAERLRAVFADQVAPALASTALDHPGARAAMVGSQVLGLALARHVLEVPVLAAMSRSEVRQWLGTALMRHLRAPMDDPD